jgi:hypothetical protein
MGLLDDAIKEHLELKRRHGADPGEVARLEHEALGPARRDPAPAAVEEPVAADPAPVADDDLFVDETGEHDEVIAEERLEAPIHHVEPEPEPVAQAPAPEPPIEVEQPTRQFSLEEVQAATSGPEAPAEPPPPAEAEAAPAEDVVPADDEPDSDDVLEETPEFLQETPEHDRLWFEQKPPRDFDF